MLTAPKHAQQEAARRGLRPRRKREASPRAGAASLAVSPLALASPRAIAARQQVGVEHRMKRRALADWEKARAELIAIETELSSTRREIAVLSPRVTATRGRAAGQWSGGTGASRAGAAALQPEPEPEAPPA